MSTNLTRAQKRARAQQAAQRFHPTFRPRVRPGSPIARVIESRMAQHTHTVTAIHRVHDAAVRAAFTERANTQRLIDAIFGTFTPGCEDCGRRVMDTHACDVKPHTLCLDCCGCPDHTAV